MAEKVKGAVQGKGQGVAGHSPALNPLYGAQNGLYPRYGAMVDGKHAAEWINAAPYISQPVIPILLETPKMFDFLPNKEFWIAASKNILENMPKSIDGLDSTLTVDSDEQDMGRGNNKFSTPTRVTKAQSKLTFTWIERMGRPISKFLYFIITTGIQNPETGRPDIIKFLDPKKDASQYGGLWTPDQYSFSMMFIETDVLGFSVEKAWLCTNMYPNGSGPEEKGSRNLTDGGSTLEISIEFPCITMDHHNAGVLALAEKLLPKVHTLRAVPDLDMVIPTASITPELDNEKLSHQLREKQGGNGQEAKDYYPAKK